MITDDMMSAKSDISKKKKKSILVVIINLIIFGAVLYFAVMFFSNNEHKKIEKEMISAAKTYVAQNTDKYSQEMYIDVGKLGYIVPSNCSSLSGVLYDGKDIIPYLSCSEYESNLESNENSKDYITLNGGGIVVLLKGMEYEEPGYISNSPVKVFGSVGMEEGIYTIYYNDEINNAIVQRKVIVIENSSLTNQYPKLSFEGPSVEYVLVNSNYLENDIKAIDDIDGDISNKVKRFGKLDLGTIGDYDVSYMVNNSRGYRSYKKRTIKVVNHIIDLDVDIDYAPKTNTKEEITVTLKVTGDSFDKVLLPNETISRNKESSYKVSENGTYKFVIYDTYGMTIDKEVTIDNIDKLMPDGTCTTILYGARSKTTVNISSSRDISDFEFIVDGQSSGILKNNIYETNTNPSKVSVKVSDVVGSTNEIDCILRAPDIYTDSKGKNCLEGYTCYIQFNYSSEKYPYCSATSEKSCGTISTNGCSITSASIAIAGFGINSKSGNLYDPYTVWDELYQINKKTGFCDAACSSWSRIKGAVKNAGLEVDTEARALTRDALSQQRLINHLKKGYPAIVHAGVGPYAAGSGHYLILLGIREENNYVFLSDPATWSGTYKDGVNGKIYYADTFISIDDLISGNITDYLLVGPPGYVF